MSLAVEDSDEFRRTVTDGIKSGPSVPACGLGSIDVIGHVVGIA